ncbi:hypothetical protein LshimejAT787_0801290 [Lyophyllum shimeji]|uniref:F-box domain-containing protein n=1 Tax=Lyophyllum shimeji TaxID=47721 RepID=A0A9P3PQN0_LYOSH|nr:hypothetical protein LshimejAT787_0801290 [Lyophyllum shimeji]
MKTLPHELVLLIFKELSDEDLRPCASVCRTWTADCQARLFQTVVVDIDLKCHRLHSVLATSPHVAPLIRDLYIVTDNVRPQVILDEEASLIAALLLLTHVESLTLRLGWNTPWHSLSVHLRDALISVLKLPSFTSLTMQRFYFDFADVDLHNILRHSTALKRLTITSAACPKTWEPSEDVFLQEVREKARLEELTIDLEFGTYGIGEWFCRPRCSLDLTGLRSLHIMHTADQVLVSRLLGVAGQSLERFHLDVEEFWPSASPPGVDLSRNIALRSLIFDFSLDSLSADECPPPWLELTLATIHPAARIKELVLVLSVHTPEDDAGEPSDTAVEDWDYGGWRRLAISLTSPCLSALEKIKVTVIYHPENPAAYKEMALRELQHLGMKLSFEVIETS